MSQSRRAVLLGGISTMAMVSSGCAGAAGRNQAPPQSASPTSLSAEPWTMPSEQAFSVTEHSWIPMRDGVRLSVRLWLPDDAASRPAPVVLEMIPYRKRDLYRAVDDIWGASLASRGIAFARLDVRGSGESEGVLTDEYAEDEISDGVEAIAWLAAQPWCSGQVGMRGISWGGINTLQVAARKPDALKAILVMGSTDNRFTDDAHYIGGALARANLQWGVQFKAVMAAPPDPAIVGAVWEEMWRERLEATPAIITKWMSHQRFDEYWSVQPEALEEARISIPAYVVSGWQDTYANPAPSILERLTGFKKVLIGPWGHTYPNLAAPRGLDWGVEEVRWWSQWLRGEDTGIVDVPITQCFMPYATARESWPEAIPGRWISADGLDREDRGQVFYIGDDEVLRAGTAGPSQMVRIGGDHVIGLAKPEWLDALPVEQSVDDERSIVFDTEPLAEDVEILGFPEIELELPEGSAQHLGVRLCEVLPDGTSWLVTYAVQNLAQLGAPTFAGASSDGSGVGRLRLRLIAHRFKAGSRIRLALSQSLWPLVWPAPGSAELMLGVGGLNLPVRPVERQPLAFGIPEVLGSAAAPEDYTPPKADGEGRYVLMKDVGPASSTNAATGAEITREQHQRAEVVEGESDSCIWSETVSTRWKRDAWDCAVEVGCEIRADAQQFLVTERVVAKRDGVQIFERTHESAVPRDGA